ncbi:MAG: hypothetical protein EOP62_14205 [Sphingomonadales bacterium]|nr:MAG: hypothetical protein EOP62_14205 [Sphingomonadales bacterium]
MVLHLQALTQGDRDLSVPGDLLTLDANEIELGERLREIDMPWAEAIGASMRTDGQINPVHVSRVAGSDKWHLAGPGGHRTMGARIAGIPIEAKFVSSDKLGQRRREVVENLFRRPNDPLERAAAIAELVRLHKLERGIDPAKDGRTASVQARWQKQLKDEAADTNATVALVYGWTADVADQIGLSRRTVENDLLLYRRLPPSLVARLREKQHPILDQAGQLRTLAKLSDADQAQAVNLLIGDDHREPLKTVNDALAQMRGANRVPSDPEAKRLSAFIGSFQRMGITEKKGALDELTALLPSGYSIVRAQPDAASEPLTPAVPIRKSVKIDYLVCLECAEKTEKLGAHLREVHQIEPSAYRARWQLPADYPVFAPTLADARRRLAKHRLTTFLTRKSQGVEA